MKVILCQIKSLSEWGIGIDIKRGGRNGKIVGIHTVDR